MGNFRKMKVEKHSAYIFLKFTGGRAYSTLIVIGSLLLTSCHHSSVKGKKVFHYNEFSGIATLDPAFAKNKSIMWAVHQLYNTLVETDNHLQIVPALARSWDISADRSTWIFHLRTDVFFQNDPAFPDDK